LLAPITEASARTYTLTSTRRYSSSTCDSGASFARSAGRERGAADREAGAGRQHDHDVLAVAGDAGVGPRRCLRRPSSTSR
jgi:hypothetical protein